MPRNTQCIVDLRPIKGGNRHYPRWTSPSRLNDYGFHAPTMSFLCGHFMIRPTESESQAEIDRFADALIAIKAEIDRIAKGELPADNNMLLPHHIQQR